MLILQETKYILFKIEKYVSNIQKKNSFKVVEIVLFADEPIFCFPLLKTACPVARNPAQFLRMRLLSQQRVGCDRDFGRADPAPTGNKKRESQFLGTLSKKSGDANAGERWLRQLNL